MKRFLVVLLLASACSSPSEKGSNADSLAMMADTTTVQDVFEESGNGAEAADTTYLTTIKSAYKVPQNDNKIAFVYRQDGLEVYSSLDDVGDTTKAAEVLAYGEMIELERPLVNSQPSDKITIEGFKGRYVSMTMADGSPGYVFSGYLTNFPVPTDSIQIVDYFLKYFQLLGSPRKITSKSKIEDTPEWFKTQLKFESGIIIDDDGYYEGASTYVTLPASCTLQEGFLLLKAFKDMEGFAGAFPTYPTSKRSQKIDDTHSATVETTAEGITSINYSDESGCSDETSVSKNDGRVVIGRGGGC
jgi:hypothetical protein